MKKTVLPLLAAFIISSSMLYAATEQKPALPEAPPVEIEENISGKVLQTMNSAGYTYLYIEKQDGKKIWVAVMETPVKVGAQMVLKPGAEMRNFESKTLKKTFDSIIFSNGVISGSVPEDKASKIVEQGKSSGSEGAVAKKSDKISVPKATGEGAVTVAEAYEKKGKLNGKKVTVSGKVVKVSVGIMGKNWIHIQDGTGSEKKKTHNLVCTSQESADVDDIITIKGKLIKDKDFGAGYKYSVIVEDAKISR